MMSAANRDKTVQMHAANHGELQGNSKWFGRNAAGIDWRTWRMVAAVWVVAVVVFLLLPNALPAFVAAVIGTAVLVGFDLRLAKSKQLADACFRFRWAIALALFAFCMSLRLHGSSIGVFDQVFPTQSMPGGFTLFGEPRWIHSDEFAVATPTCFSQAYNDCALNSRACAEQKNRYANMPATIVEEATWVESLDPDQVVLRINPQILEVLQVRDLFTTKDLAEMLARYGTGCEYVAVQDGYSVYQLDCQSQPSVRWGGE